MREINLFVTWLKTFLLTNANDFLEESVWEDFCKSEIVDEEGGFFHLFDDDFPGIRDLKVLINMLTVMERATLQSSKIMASLYLLHDGYFFKRNFDVFMSTDSVLTHYLKDIEDYYYISLLPKIINSWNKLKPYLTKENLEKAREKFIEQFIALDRYQKSLHVKDHPESQPEEVEEKPHEGLFTLLVKKNREYLKLIYTEDEYKTYFVKPKKVEVTTSADLKEGDIVSDKKEVDSESKSDDKPVASSFDETFDAYPEHEKDTNSRKHLKKLLNGVVEIKNVLDVYEKYKKDIADYDKKTWSLVSLSSYVPTKVYATTWIPTFFSELNQVYTSFNEFDYQALAAEPVVEKVKRTLIDLNNEIEKLVCLADELEGQHGLKPGSLLKYVKEFILEQYDQITTELNIPVSRVQQKRLYQKARLQSREKYLKLIEKQIEQLTHFLGYKNVPLFYIKLDDIIALQKWIAKYENDISMNRDHLAKYKEYLSKALHDEFTFRKVIATGFEYLANVSGMTLHSELMNSLSKMRLYLIRQQAMLKTRYEALSVDYRENPYDNFKFADVKTGGDQKHILAALNNHIAKLNRDKKKVLQSVIGEKEIESVLSAAQENTNQPDESKVETVKKIEPVKLDELKIEPPTKPINAAEINATKTQEISARQQNIITLKVKEHKLFSSAKDTYEKTNDLPSLLESLRKEDGFCPDSMIFLDELEQISKTSVPECKEQMPECAGLQAKLG
ncbi:MAG: PIN domain-containing protein [Gammaproteobacteria bacterium]